ncbi:uncharacterized protein JCM10292_005639 [Rhodotorula paludigena]|uniref:uncharacterized protein n=1 Tax=Rhodotorula paludigena TaxID=86838 RepID=UPI003172A1AA
MSSADPAPAPKKGLWDSLSPEDQKKAATVFLVSLGVTLLVTGRSGGKLLKRAKASEAAAPPPAPPKRAAPSRPPPTPAPAPPPAPASRAPPVQRSASAENESSSALPAPPPSSFLHPNSLTPPKPRRFLPSFVSSAPAAPLSVLSSRPAASSYFLPNPTLTAQSTAFATQLDKLDKLHEEGAEMPPPPDDGFNPAVYAMKALGIATLLTVGTFSAGVYGVMKWLGVDDLESLALALQHRLPGVFDAHRPTVPAWALPSAQPAAEAPSVSSADAAKEEEELSYWTSIKETLDREAEENRRERRGAWERMRRKAQEAGGERVV